MARRPRLGWQSSKVSKLVEAEWTQWSRPTARLPVSSKCTTRASWSRSRVASRNGRVASDASVTIWARAPTETGAESTSLNS
jgi:hypothetical protein